MAYGKIEYDKEGKPKCEICGLYFKRVLTHVRQKHNLSEREYKTRFGFDLIKGICSKESSEKTKLKTISNYDKCIRINLVEKGKKTRKIKGDSGRTRDMVSAQTKQMLKDRLKQSYMVEAMKKSGKKVGKSGLGNLKRWGEDISEEEELVNDIMMLMASFSGKLYGKRSAKRRKQKKDESKKDLNS